MHHRTIDLNIYDGEQTGNIHINAYDDYANQQIASERKPSTMLNAMRKKRSTQNFNENHVTDTQNNGKLWHLIKHIKIIRFLEKLYRLGFFRSLLRLIQI